MWLVSGLHSFSWLSYIPVVFISWLHLLNSATVNIHTQILIQICFCASGADPGEILLSYMVAWSMYVYYLKNRQMAFHSDRTTHIHNLLLTAVQGFLISTSVSLLLPISLYWSFWWLRSTIELWFLFVSFILNDTEQIALYLQTT